jgi:hypothetical protein
MRPLPPAVHIATALVLVNMLVAAIDGPGWLVAPLLLLGPVVVLWMVWRVLRDTSVPMADLREGDEWGYGDRMGEHDEPRPQA